jgi:uncharacterized protein (TIGR00288 family)
MQSSLGNHEQDERQPAVGQRRRRIAVLIDAENIAAKEIGRVMAELGKFGDVVIRRAYGDFNGPQGTVWEATFARHAIVPHHQFSYGRGKNAADIALVIDAMDLLHNGACDAFSIVSTDSDFMRLAIRIREQNVDCYVFGNEKTSDRFRRAASRFIHLENLKFDGRQPAANAQMKPLRPLKEAQPLITPVVASLQTNPAGWVELDLLERELERQLNDFDPRTYGFVRLRDLLIALKRPLIVDEPRGQKPRVRLKSKKPNSRTIGKSNLDGSADNADGGL